MSICYFPPPHHLHYHIDISWQITWKEPAQTRGSSRSRRGLSCKKRCASSFHIKRLENAALFVLLPPFPDNTQWCALQAEKTATQMTLSPEAEALPRAKYSEARPKSSQCTEVGLSTVPWHACQNESGGWHTGSQIRVKECVCAE